MELVDTLTQELEINEKLYEEELSRLLMFDPYFDYNKDSDDSEHTSKEDLKCLSPNENFKKPMKNHQYHERQLIHEESNSRDSVINLRKREIEIHEESQSNTKKRIKFLDAEEKELEQTLLEENYHSQMSSTPMNLSQQNPAPHSHQPFPDAPNVKVGRLEEVLKNPITEIYILCLQNVN